MEMIGVERLSLSLVGIEPEDGAAGDEATGLRFGLALAKRAGYAAVQLNAAAPGLRARELDQSARRGVATSVKRMGLTVSGLDLWIPPEHFGSGEHADRAVSAVLAALEWCADLMSLSGSGGRGGRGVLAMALPRPVPADVRAALVAGAEKWGPTIADHAWPAEEVAIAAPAGMLPLGVGIDPAAIFAAGLEPAACVSRCAGRVVSARLSDLSASGRTVPGRVGSRLDLLSYAAALATSGFGGAVVADLRQVRSPVEGAEEAVRVWQERVPAIPGG